jgi:SAM-dependent methyltransferase
MEWFKHWFNDIYIELYAHRDETEAKAQVELLLSLLGQPPSSIVCDVCCGAGRHLKALIDSGITAVGLDLSEHLLKRAVDLPVVRADKRRLPFRDSSIGGLTSFFTSFGYFQTEAEHLALLKEYRRVLKPGGFLFLDLPNREWVKSNLVPLEELATARGPVRITREVTAENRVIKRIDLVEGSYQEDVQLFSPEEVTALLGQTGYQVSSLQKNISRIYFLARSVVPDL